METLEKRTEHLLSKLQQVFRDGYRPARGTQSYNIMLKNKAKIYAMVNCFGHIFNLQNQQFNDYHFDAFPLFGNFSGMGYEPQDKAAKRLLEFIRAAGLKVEACDPTKTVEDFKSWKIAIYFEKNPHKRDFHLLLEEQPNLWSSKIGFEPCVEHIFSKEPPELYYNLVDDDPVVYELFEVDKVTNPFADANCKYLKNFKFNSTGLKKLPPVKQCVIEDAREDSFEKMLELCAARGLI